MAIFIKKRNNIKANTKKLCKNCGGVNNRPKSDYCCEICRESYFGRFECISERRDNFTMIKGW